MAADVIAEGFRFVEGLFDGGAAASEAEERAVLSHPETTITYKNPSHIEVEQPSVTSRPKATPKPPPKVAGTGESETSPLLESSKPKTGPRPNPHVKDIPAETHAPTTEAPVKPKKAVIKGGGRFRPGYKSLPTEDPAITSTPKAEPKAPEVPKAPRKEIPSEGGGGGAKPTTTETETETAQPRTWGQAAIDTAQTVKQGVQTAVDTTTKAANTVTTVTVAGEVAYGAYEKVKNIGKKTQPTDYSTPSYEDTPTGGGGSGGGSSSTNTYNIYNTPAPIS